MRMRLREAHEHKCCMATSLSVSLAMCLQLLKFVFGWWQCAENKAEFIRLGAVDVLRKLASSPIPSLHGNALAALEQLEIV